MKTIAPILACTTASVAVAIILHAAPDRPQAAWAVIPAIAWGLLALGSAWRLRHVAAAPLLVLLVGALVRIPLIGTPLHLSDDAWRYLWEGVVLNAGLDPFSNAPATLGGLDDAVRSRVNHPELPSIYPPLALWWFRAVAIVHTTWAVQATAALADLVTVAAIAGWRRDRGESPWPAWLYALHPLAAIESAASGHLEALAVAATAVALWAWNRRRHDAAVGLLVLGAGLKLFPALLLPSLVRSRRGLVIAAAATLAVVLLAWPVWGAGSALVTSLRAYTDQWSFNGLFFPLLEPTLGAATRPILIATGAAVMLGAWRFSTGPVAVWTAAGAAFVVLSPTVHPWYLLWVLVPSLLSGRWGWSVASIAFLPSYLVLFWLDPTTGAWSVPWWLAWITWGPALAALSAEWWLRGRQSKERAAR